MMIQTSRRIPSGTGLSPDHAMFPLGSMSKVLHPPWMISHFQDPVAYTAEQYT